MFSCGNSDCRRVSCCVVSKTAVVLCVVTSGLHWFPRYGICAMIVALILLSTGIVMRAFCASSVCTSFGTSSCLLGFVVLCDLVFLFKGCMQYRWKTPLVILRRDFFQKFVDCDVRVASFSVTLWIWSSCDDRCADSLEYRRTWSTVCMSVRT